MPDLFTPYTLEGATLRNRIVMSPITMYRSVDVKREWQDWDEKTVARCQYDPRPVLRVD